MKKQKTPASGPAVFMYCVIALCAVMSALSFVLYYTQILKNEALFWIGVTCFTIMYHLWMRIIMGNVTKLFTINYTMPFFKEKPFEKKLYKLLRVKKWKGNALTYNPHLFSLQNNSLADIANTMCKAETDHIVNVFISLSTLLFALLWGQLWIFALTAFLAILFDSQFIVIQRYNRPRVLRLIEREKRHKEETIHHT